MPRLFAVWLLVCASASVSRAQVHSVLSNWREHKISVRPDTVSLDSMSVVPGTVSIPGIDTADFGVNGPRALLWWKHRPPGDSVSVSYRVFPFRFPHEAARYRFDSISHFMVTTPFYNRHHMDEDDPTQFDFGNITYNGSYGRSLSFGNNQDAVVNSSLNLQINGYIGDSILLSAAITDNNVPVQPDGSTQQLSEFDKVFIQFKKRDWTVALGDIDMRRNEGDYFNFYKRLQGVSIEDDSKVFRNGANRLILSGAVSKGIFARNVFQGQEGNQGPYPLTGNNNETYLVVLAGTERVYIDGVLMQRGEDQDYVINYNTAEITFTAKRMISQDQRIQVEFEYADQNYLNSLLLLGDDMKVNSKLNVQLNAYSSTDAKNSPLNQVLTAPQKQFLAQLGDSVQNAYYPSAVKDTFSASAVMYAMRDSLVNGVRYDSVFVYSTNPDSALYSVAFTDRGAGNGNYVLVGTAAGGNVYQWSPPVGGVKTGEFDPVILLIAPQRQRMVSTGFTYQMDKRTKFMGEWAVSDFNPNTFASGNTDEVGMAGKVGAARVQPVNKDLQLSTNFSMEWVQQKFMPLERLRTPEFYRDWGLPIIQDQENEVLGTAGIGIKDKYLLLHYDFSNFRRGSSFNGQQHVLTNTWSRYGWQWRAQLSLTNFDSSFNHGMYWRPSLQLEKVLTDWHKITVGGRYDLEKDQIDNRRADSLDGISYEFATWQAYMRSAPGKESWSVNYTDRKDYSPFGENLVAVDQSHTLTGDYQWTVNPHQQIKVNATYRELDVMDGKLTEQVPENTLLGRAQYLTNMAKGAITGNILYELGAGQQQQMQYTFVQVPAGTGQYTWVDYNHDGIAEINEFAIAQYQDQADYIKVWQPTGNYIKADYTTLNYSLTLNPKAVWGGKHATAAEKWFARFMVQSSMQVNKKVASEGLVQFNPFSGNPNDTALISLNEVLNNALFFNKLSPKWGFDLVHTLNSTKAFLTYGAQSQALRDVILRWRWNITRQYAFNLDSKLEKNYMLTPAYANENYVINAWQTAPQFSYIKGTKFRVAFGGKWLRQQNSALYGGQESTTRGLTADGKYNVVSNTSLTAHFEVDGISYNAADQTTTVAYTMLQGLTTGTNYVWTIDLTKRLLGNVELTLSYDGRKPGQGIVINTGRASVRALF